MYKLFIFHNNKTVRLSHFFFSLFDVGRDKLYKHAYQFPECFLKIYIGSGIQEADIGKDIIEGVPNKLPTLSATLIPKKVKL